MNPDHRWRVTHDHGDTVAPGRPDPGPPTPTERARTVDALLRLYASLPAADPDRPRLRQRAVEAALPMTGLLARRYAGRGESLDDLTQVASVGLLKAINGFDPSYRADFWVYATPTILGGLKRHFRDKGWAVGVPRRYKDLWLEINRCRGEMAQRLMRLPAVTELAERLGTDQQEIVQAMVAGNSYASTSLFAPLGDEDSERVVDGIGVPEPGYDLVDLHATIQPALAGLPQRERTIIALRFFGNMTQAQIARQIGVSQMHVSRLLADGLRRMRLSLRDAY